MSDLRERAQVAYEAAEAEERERAEQRAEQRAQEEAERRIEIVALLEDKLDEKVEPGNLEPHPKMGDVYYVDLDGIVFRYTAGRLYLDDWPIRNLADVGRRLAAEKEKAAAA